MRRLVALALPLLAGGLGGCTTHEAVLRQQAERQRELRADRAADFASNPSAVDRADHRDEPPPELR